MKIYLVRHGESLGNAKHVLLGHTDLDLSELGYMQARVTAEAMRAFPIDVIYSSDLKRAFNTAEPHARLRGISVIPDRLFRECHIGAWENRSGNWCRENYPVEYTETWVNDFGRFTFPQGESTRAAGERFLSRALEVCRANSEKNILIASHAAIIRSFWDIISAPSSEDIVDVVPFPTNASYSVCEFDGERFIPLEYSIDGHLSEIGITKFS